MPKITVATATGLFGMSECPSTLANHFSNDWTVKF